MLYQKLRGDQLKISWSPDTGNSVCTRGGAHGCRWPVSLRAEQRGRRRLPELPRSCPGQIQGLSSPRLFPVLHARLAPAPSCLFTSVCGLLRGTPVAAGQLPPSQQVS